MSAPAATGVTCPLCGWSGPEFLPQGRGARANARCQGCNSMERHRALYLYLRDHTRVLEGPTRLLHFAPENALRAVFEAEPAIEYVTTDLEMEGVSVRMDICELLFRDGVFDCVICSHVLEHVPDDHRAMSEVLRVLKPDGLALIMVPILGTPDGKTYEDPAIVTPEERERAFGQRDHVRIYGEDFPDRLRDAGFDVEEVKPGSNFEPGSIERFGLYPKERIFVCRRGGVQAGSAPRPTPGPTPSGTKGMVAFNTRISVDDEMLRPGSTEPYFRDGLAALRAIEAALERVGASDPQSILDQPSGHGQVSRMLRARFPEAVITACDADRKAAEFCRDELGADQAATPDVLQAEARYDLIWCDSLEALPPGEGSRAPLPSLVARLERQGVLLFGTHSDRSDTMLESRARVRGEIAAISDLELVSAARATWRTGQDVYVCRRTRD